MFKDEIVSRTTVTLSFADRLRVLIGGKITITVNTKTENEVGATQADSMVSVERVYKRPVQLCAGIGAYNT